MTPATENLITELSANFRAALQANEIELAKSIETRINQLIEYGTGIKT